MRSVPLLLVGAAALLTLTAASLPQQALDVVPSARPDSVRTLAPGAGFS